MRGLVPKVSASLVGVCVEMVSVLLMGENVKVSASKVEVCTYHQTQWPFRGRSTPGNKIC